MREEIIKMKYLMGNVVFECERFANRLEDFKSFREEFTNKEWDELANELNEEDKKYLQDLGERYCFQLKRISKCK